jgi:ABC-2 type transport system ATP-binding protein
VIEATGLVKRFGRKTAVDDLSFTVRPGVVTGFLGPNGAGKSTTMRLLLGLDSPDRGQSTINGKRHSQMRAPLREVGALLEAKAVHGGRSARNHLLALAASNNIPKRRVDEVLGIVGLDEVARKRAGGFSLGMGQRLGLAAALLGDPPTLLLDEPVNGLDPEGIRWIRTMLQTLAAEGRTVFVSSHLMSEMAVTATEIIVVGRGHLITSGSVADLVAGASTGTVLVRTTDDVRFAEALAAAGAKVQRVDGALQVTGLASEAIGGLSVREQIALAELTPQQASLEEAYLELTGAYVEYGATAPQAEYGAAVPDVEYRGDKATGSVA